MKFEPNEAITYLHDEISKLINVYQNAAKSAAFTSALGRVNHLEYTDEESGLSIVAPKTPGDLIREGKTLSHCVASFVDPIINGTENVLFIRHTDNIDTPYFTMALSNVGDIEQIHCYCNGQITEDGQRNAFERSGMPVYKEVKDISSFLIKWTKAKAKSEGIRPKESSIKSYYGALCARH